MKELAELVRELLKKGMYLQIRPSYKSGMTAVTIRKPNKATTSELIRTHEIEEKLCNTIKRLSNELYRREV